MIAADCDCPADRLGPGFVAGDARQAPPLRPAAVAVHDDGDVARDLPPPPSPCAPRGPVLGSLAEDFLFLGGAASSISPIVLSVSFWTSVSSRLRSSSLISRFFSSGLEVIHPVAADVADGDPRLFGILAGKLGEFLAALLGQLGDRQADVLAVDDRVEAEARRCGSPFRPARRWSCPTPGPTAAAARAPRPSPPGSAACLRHRPRPGSDRAAQSRHGRCAGRRDRASAPRRRPACGA